MSGRHAPQRRNHLWVLFAIALPAAVEVWASWVGVGSRSGFPVMRVPLTGWSFSTGFSLAVGMEAYWGYALFVWLAAAPGPRSRKFAMGSAIGAFTLSLLGQVAYHVMLAEHVAVTPILVVIFVAALPVTLLALVALLIHLMHTDRRDAELAAELAAKETAEAEREAAEMSELAALRAELNEAREASRAVQADLATARAEAAEATARAEALARKLAAIPKPGAARGSSRKPAGKPTGSATGSGTRKPDTVTGPQDSGGDAADVDREALVLKYLGEGHTASEAGRLAGLTDSRGRQIARKLAKAAPEGLDGGGSSS